MPVSEDIQGFDVGTLVELYSVDLHPLGRPEVVYFTPSLEGGNSQVVWGGQAYDPLEIVVDGFEYSLDRAFPQPRMKVSNVGRAFTELNYLYRDMVGAIVTRTVTLEKYLDSGSSPATDEYLSRDAYNVDRKVAQNKVYVEYELASAIDQEGFKVPARTFNKDVCSHIYRRWSTSSNDWIDDPNVTCPYANSSVDFNLSNEPLTPSQFSEAACNKRLSGCKARFGQFWVTSDSSLPFQGFPGMAEYER